MAGHPLRFFDCNCGIGPHYSPGPGRDWSAKALLEKMDDLGIAEAAAYELSGNECDPAAANARVIEDVRGRDRLHPVWHVGGHHDSRFPAVSTWVNQAIQSRVKMVRLRLAPKAVFGRLDFPLLEKLFDALTSKRIVLYLDTVETGGYLTAQELKTLLETWPALPVILGVPKIEQEDWVFYRLWEQFTHFYVELSGYQVLNGIETVTERFGHNRLVFGTRYPFFTPLQAMLQVIYSRVDDAVKEDIAGGTFRRLLDEVQT